MNHVSFDLNLLVVLEAVLSEGSVVKASRKLHVSASAVSNSLAKLRELLGDPLFVRRGRGVVPTPRAEALAPLLGRSLSELAQVIHPEAFDPRLARRAFTIAVNDVDEMARLPPIAALLMKEMPLSTLRAVGFDSLVSLGGLAGSEVDVSFGLPLGGPEIHALPLFTEPVALVARVGHPLADSRARSTFAKLRHVAVEMVPVRRAPEMVAETYERAGLPRQVVITVPSFTGAAAMVASTDLVATIPAALLEVLGPRLGLRAMALATPPHTKEIHLLWHERTHADPAMIYFRDVVRRSLGAKPAP